MLSRRILFNGLSNMRDLGGMAASDGRMIKNGLLYRSGRLNFADDGDLAALKDLNIAKIIDLRNETEQNMAPDPVIPKAERISIPVITQSVAGITQERDFSGLSFEEGMKLIKKYPDVVTNYLQNTYITFVSSPYSRSQYKRFTEELISAESGAVLWHCTSGKDRTGFAAVIIEEILGVDRQTIIDDYLSSNKYLKEKNDRMFEKLLTEMDRSEAENVVENFYIVKKEYIDAVYRYIDNNYGGFEGFLSEGLGIGENDKARLRARYLE